MSRLIIKLSVVVLILLGAFFLYRYLFVSSPDLDPGLVSSGPISGNASVSTVANDEFIRLLERLQGVNLNSDLFSSPAWSSLVNFRVELVDEPKGRRNPFSETGFDPISTTTTTGVSGVSAGS